MKTLTDIELCAKVATDAYHREAAFSELYRRHARRVFVYCRHRVNDPSIVDDVYQETFIRFYKKIREGHEVRNVPSYLLRIARNLSMDVQNDRSFVEYRMDLSEFASDEMYTEESDLSQLVALALDLLVPEQKEALLLQVYGEFSYAEIADELGVPISTVRNWLVRSKRQLREILLKRLHEFSR